jgi:hypothetical protein
MVSERIKLVDFSRDERVCEMVVGDKRAEVRYCPSSYTPQAESELQRALENNRPSTGMAELLARRRQSSNLGLWLRRSVRYCGYSVRLGRLCFL